MCTFLLFQMIELMPGTNVYVYPKDVRVVGKMYGGCRKARYLLSAFYTNQELVAAGNITGVNGKSGLNQQVIKAITGMYVVILC